MSTAHWQARRLPIPAAWPARSGRAAHPWAIISAGLAPILLTGSYLMAGIFQPASYSPVRSTISAMAGQAGTDRWVMTGGIFLVSGCYLVTAAGLTGVRASARAMLAVAGMAGIGIAASPEPARGATPRHLVWTVLGAVAIAAWPAFAVADRIARDVRSGLDSGQPLSYQLVADCAVWCQPAPCVARPTPHAVPPAPADRKGRTDADDHHHAATASERRRASRWACLPRRAPARA